MSKLSISILDTLAHADKQRCVHMLDGCARTDIESYCNRGQYDHVEASGTVLWIDISQLPECPQEKRYVQDAIWWCEMRGLFTHHAEHKHLVRFKTRAREQYEKAPETSEATDA